MEKITKVSETEVEIETTIPEKIIPEEIRKERVSLTGLKAKKASLKASLAQNIEWKKTPQAELNKINNDIANIQAELETVDVRITRAVDAGTVEVAPVIEEVLPVEKKVII